VAFAAGAYPPTGVVFGRPYGDGWPVLVALAFGLPATLASSGCKVDLTADGRETDAVRWGTASLALQTLATALLVPRWGASGAALALGAGEWLVHGRLRQAWRAPALTPLEARGRA
jgi:O-antigen/teichoic acid export membrane protein